MSAFSSFAHKPHSIFFFFFFNDTATTEIYTLSLHDALPIFPYDDLVEFWQQLRAFGFVSSRSAPANRAKDASDRKSTRLNSSHGYISYAVFCLKKKKRTKEDLVSY